MGALSLQSGRQRKGMRLVVNTISQRECVSQGTKLSEVSRGETGYKTMVYNQTEFRQWLILIFLVNLRV